MWIQQQEKQTPVLMMFTLYEGDGKQKERNFCVIIVDGENGAGQAVWQHLPCKAQTFWCGLQQPSPRSRLLNTTLIITISVLF